jgi:hypothetical protein
MAYNTKAIKTDVNAKPIPQLYNPVTDEYEVLQGTGGAARQVLYGPDGQPISTTEGKLAVRAEELEMAIANLQTALLDNQSTAAKQDALAGLIGALDAVAVSDPAAAGAVIALLKGLLSRLQTLEGKIDGITDGTAPAKTETQLTGSKVKNAFEIIPDDATDLSHETIAIYVGFDGDLKVDLISGETITMYNLAAGAWHPIQAKRVYATGTAATYILGAY